ncbi:MAG: hypothetical protein VKJ46_09290, partial [Leptolyngbyaceae bacterium]|nr:hypothetical protein [Leptolyngbyaceae bacterium]
MSKSTMLKRFTAICNVTLISVLLGVGVVNAAPIPIPKIDYGPNYNPKKPSTWPANWQANCSSFREAYNKYNAGPQPTRTGRMISSAPIVGKSGERGERIAMESQRREYAVAAR